MWLVNELYSATFLPENCSTRVLSRVGALHCNQRGTNVWIHFQSGRPWEKDNELGSGRAARSSSVAKVTTEVVA